VRLWDERAPGAIPLDLPPRNLRHVGLVLAVFFAIFAAVEWMGIARMSRHDIDSVFDLTFALFETMWVLGWSVGVFILGALTFLFLFYSESARLHGAALVHIARLGPLAIQSDYDLAKVRNLRLEQKGGTDADAVIVRFDYNDGSNTLGEAMRRVEGQRIVDTIAKAARFSPSLTGTLSEPIPPSTTIVAQDRSAHDTVMPRVATHLPQRTTGSVIALVAANLYPLLGVLLLDWDLASVMVLYWAESAIIAFYTVLKIAVAGQLIAILAVPVFISHFGAFMSVHFLLIYGLFLRQTGVALDSGVAAELSAIFLPIWTSIAALFISHGISFSSNFVGRREYEQTSVSALMNAPYKRVIVMHLTLIFGGWIVLLFGMPDGALGLLLILKTAVDLRAHRNEHARDDRRYE
jgi:hypothetical protein